MKDVYDAVPWHKSENNMKLTCHENFVAICKWSLYVKLCFLYETPRRQLTVCGTPFSGWQQSFAMLALERGSIHKKFSSVDYVSYHSMIIMFHINQYTMCLYVVCVYSCATPIVRKKQPYTLFVAWTLNYFVKSIMMILNFVDSYIVQ